MPSLALADLLKEQASLLIGVVSLFVAAALFVAAVLQRGRLQRLVALFLSFFSVAICISSFSQVSQPGTLSVAERKASLLSAAPADARRETLLLIAQGREGQKAFIEALSEVDAKRRKELLAALRELPRDGALAILTELAASGDMTLIRASVRELARRGVKAQAAAALAAVTGDIAALAAAAEGLSVLDPAGIAVNSKIGEGLRRAGPSDQPRTAALVRAALRTGTPGGALLHQAYPTLKANAKETMHDVVLAPPRDASPNAYAVLLKAAPEPLRLAALHGARALPQRGALCPLVLRLVESEPGPLRTAALAALPAIGAAADEALPLLAEELRGRDDAPAAAEQAPPPQELLEAVARYGDSELLRALLHDPRPSVAAGMLQAVEELRDHARLAALLAALLTDGDERVRERAAAALRKLGGANAVLLIDAAIEHQNVRAYALLAVEEAAPAHLERELRALTRLLAQPDPDIYRLAARALARIGPAAAAAVPELASGLRGGDPQRCLDAAEALQRIGSWRARLTLFGFALRRSALSFGRALLRERELSALMLLVLLGYGVYCTVLYRRGQRQKILIVAAAPLLVLAIYFGGLACGSARSLSACPVQAPER